MQLVATGVKCVSIVCSRLSMCKHSAVRGNVELK